MKNFFHHNKFLRKSYSENAANLATTMATLLVAFVVGSSYLFGVFALPSQALATDSQIAAVGFGLEKAANQANLTTNESLGSRVGSVLKVVFNILGIVFLLVVVVAGLMWMTAAGNEDIIRKSKQAIVAASIGFIVVFLSGTIVQYFTETARETSMPKIKNVDADPIKISCTSNDDCDEGYLCSSGECITPNDLILGACINANDCSCSELLAKDCSQGYQFIENSICSDVIAINAIQNCKNSL